MNLMLIWHTIAGQWPLALAIGVLALGVMFPAVSVPMLRWVLGTERGRWLLAITLFLLAFFWYREARFSDGYSAAVADQKAKAAGAHVDAAEAVAKRDRQGDAATDTATASANQRQTDHTTRAERVEGYAHESRTPVPAVCPGPDPRIVRELREGSGRVSTAEDRLRSLGGAQGQATRPAGADR